MSFSRCHVTHVLNSPEYDARTPLIGGWRRHEMWHKDDEGEKQQRVYLAVDFG